MVSRFKGSIINLHGGDPEKYRGLDSHLWTIYHEDWDRLITCLHILDEKLDNGDIIAKKHLDLSKITDLSRLRAINTVACFDLTLSALKQYEERKSFNIISQSEIGRYYSFMPSSLKTICIQKI